MPRDHTRSWLRSRRGDRDLRRTLRREEGVDWGAIIRAPAVHWAALIWGVLAVVVGGAAVWTREQPLVAVGRVMTDTRTVRSSFEIADETATDRARELARQQSPRAYAADTAVLEGILASLESLPKALADASSLEDVEPGIREQFGLTEESLAAIRGQVLDGEVRDRWAARVQALGEYLLRTPLIDPAAYQIEITTPSVEVELLIAVGGDESPTVLRVPKRSLLNIQSGQLADEVRTLSLRSGIAGPLTDVVINRLAVQPRATFVLDQAASTTIQEKAAAAVEPRLIRHRERDVIFRRGDVLRPEQMELFRMDLRHTAQAQKWWQRWASRAGVLGVVGAIAAALAGYTLLFCPAIRRNPARVGGIAVLLAITAVVACIATAARPDLVALTALAPTMFVAVLLCAAYDRRVALAFASLHGVLVCVGLNLPIGALALMIAGIGAAVWQLRELRERGSLIRMSVIAAGVLAASTVIAGLLELPVTPETVRQTLWDAGLAAFSGLLVGGVTLFILPSVERMFDIVTGMTLIELRDPKQSLLRQLQQRAPGTYNHSLNVASLAEAAAEAIGSNGLLTYVGALYHDIGKMNKPDYFVENQVPGFNRHDKLSPAMSLLVIVGHVKDGIELAREFGLPTPLHHFIEAHHGTTLVEYFYHRARRQAAADDGGDAGEGPDEIEYRYPGPRPTSKECAILMLCDAVESTARSMADPTPSRIDATVRALATKRLMDGQFDESDLTLRELNVVVETVSKTLAAIYHGRIAYPAAMGAGAPANSGSHAAVQLPRTEVIAVAGMSAPAGRGPMAAERSA